MKFLIIVSGFILFGTGFSSVQAQVITDSVMYQRDSVIEPEPDPTTQFFQAGEKTKTPEKIMLVTKLKKTISLQRFLISLSGGQADAPVYTDHAFADLDNDGKKELVISNYTGGAHCCDELYLFKNIGINKYQYAGKLFAGNTVITDKKEFNYSFYEQFGYFFTCFACGYADTSDAAPVEITSIMLKYNKGKFVIIPGDQELRSTITDNLGKMGEQPYEKLDNEMAQDNGLRKEFAINLAVFYYSFGKNLPETQKLFTKYYKFPDAKKVWTAFTRQLLDIKANSDF